MVRGRFWVCCLGRCAWEDCGKDAHKHFYDHGSKCPTEGLAARTGSHASVRVQGGPLFIEYNLWQEYQSNRKAQCFG